MKYSRNISSKSKSSIYLLALVFAFFIISCNEATQPSTGIVPSSSKIKSQTKWLIDNYQDIKIRQVNFKNFNSDGKILSNIDYSIVGDKTSESKFTYQGDNGLEIRLSFDNNQELINKISCNYVYDVNGKISSQTFADSSGIVYKTVNYNYDNKGNISKKEEFDINKGVIKTYDYSYISNAGNVTELKTSIIDGTSIIVLRDSISYNQPNNAVNKYNFDDTGSVKTIFTYFYDLAGRIKIEVEKDSKGNILNRYLYDYTFF